MASRRILVTGLSTYWGGRLAQALERFPEVEAVIGVDSEEPRVELDRTEYVKVGAQHALLRRVVEAAEIDTVVDTRLIVDSSTTGAGVAHENNILGTMNILAACAGAPVRKVVFKSSTLFYGSEQDDPAFFEESMDRPHPPRTPIERDVVEAEAAVADFADRNPETTVSVLRFANVLGPEVRTAHIDLLSLPAIPMILGFDPRLQFVHEDDVVHALEHAVARDLPGVYNVAADGVLALSEVADLLGKPYAPILPPWGTGLATSALRRLGVNVPPEAMGQLRFGRGVDNRRLKASGFHYGRTSREAVLELGRHLRLSPVMRGAQEPYRYEREVEEFLRWSPHVKQGGERRVRGLSRDGLAELRRLLDGLETDDAAGAGPDPTGERLTAAEERADATEERLRAAEERAEAAERAAERAVQRAKKAEQRAAESALKATERAKKAEKRAAAAAEDAAHRAADEAAQKAAKRAAATPPPAPAGSPVEHYDDLAAEEVIALLASRERDDLETLRSYERRHANRVRVLSAIESVLARRETRV